MMGPAKPPKGADPDAIPGMACVDANMLPCSVMPPDPVSKVLDDDSLLIEIILRLGFPTTLVRAGLVCKRWYNHASGPAFLHRFHKLHPPRLLGFYVNTGEELHPARFVPMLRRPPELESVFRHTSFSLDAYEEGQPYVAECWKSSVLIDLVCYNGTRRPVKVVHNPFFPERGMTVVPPSPRLQLSDGNKMGVGHLLIKVGDNLSYFYVFLETTLRTESTVHVHMFQDGVWCKITSATNEFHCELQVKPLLVDNKIYILASPCGILVFDLRALSFSTIQLPQGVVDGPHFFTMNPLGLDCGGRTILSPVDDDLGVYLIHVNELQLVIWLREGDNWLLVDTICLREMCADLTILDRRLANNGFVEITMVGPNAEFVLLDSMMIWPSLGVWDIKCRVLLNCMRSQEMIEVCVVSILS